MYDVIFVVIAAILVLAAIRTQPRGEQPSGRYRASMVMTGFGLCFLGLAAGSRFL